MLDRPESIPDPEGNVATMEAEPVAFTRSTSSRGSRTDFASIDKAMPAALESEEQIFGYIINGFPGNEEQTDAATRIAELKQQLPSADAFHHPLHRLLWEAICEVAERNQPVDFATVANRLNERGERDKVGMGLVSRLFSFWPLRIGFGHTVRIVREKWLLRCLITQSVETITSAQRFGKDEAHTDVASVIGSAERRCFDLLELQQSQSDTPDSRDMNANELTSRWIDRMETAIHSTAQIHGLCTGIIDIDRVSGGFCNGPDGDMFMLAAWPGMGKSALAVSIIEGMSIDQKIPGLIFPLEMGRDAYMDRLIPGRVGINTNILRSHIRIGDDEQVQLARACAEIRHGAFECAPQSFIDIATLCAKVQVHHRKRGIKYILIDHLGQVKPSTDKGMADERLGEKEVMEGLHSLRKSLGILVIVLVQLNKAAKDKAKSALPHLADIKGAAEKTEYPTCVAFIQRPVHERPWHVLNVDTQNAWTGRTKQYREALPHRWTQAHEVIDGISIDEQDYTEHAFLCFRKNRNGPTPDNVPLRFQAREQRFRPRTDKLMDNNPSKRQPDMSGF
jgi:replicative DNA helicase